MTATDYVPSTEEVRRVYTDEGGGDFNAWLSSHDAEVRESCAQAAVDAAFEMIRAIRSLNERAYMR